MPPSPHREIVGSKMVDSKAKATPKGKILNAVAMSNQQHQPNRWASRHSDHALLTILPRFLAGQSCLPPVLDISFCEPSAGFDQLDHVDYLFTSADRCTYPGEDPWNRTVHLICSCSFEGTCAPWIEKEGAWNRVRGGPRLGRGD